MTEKPPAAPPKRMTPEERQQEEDKLIERIAARVAEKLAAGKQVQLPYSVCPGCGYLFKSVEEEEKYDECPRCEYRGPATRLHWETSEERKP